MAAGEPVEQPANDVREPVHPELPHGDVDRHVRRLLVVAVRPPGRGGDRGGQDVGSDRVDEVGLLGDVDELRR